METPRVRVLEIFSLLLLALISVAFYQIMAPFLLDAFLSVVFTNVFFRLYGRVRGLIGGREYPAAGITVLVVLIVVAVPVSVIGLLVYSEAVRGYAAIRSMWPTVATDLGQIEILRWAADLPFLGEYVAQFQAIDLNELVRGALEASSQFIIRVTQQSFVSITQAVLNFVLVLFLMFFMFVDGPKLVRRIYDITPMPDKEMDEIVEETLNTTSATLISTIIIGIIEGTFGAVLFIIFGLPSPFLWGVIIMILSMIPLIGTNLVIVPAGVILIATGRIGGGILLIALGFGGVAITQNVIKPKLLGDRAGLHPALVLLATIGGIAWLGLIGFLVGPLLASLFIVVWEQFAKRYALVLASKRREPQGEETGIGDTQAGDSGPAGPRGKKAARGARSRKRSARDVGPKESRQSPRDPEES